MSVLKVPEPRPASQTSAFLNLGATHKALFHLESGALQCRALSYSPPLTLFSPIGYEVQYFHHVRLPPREEDIAEEFQRILNSMKSSEEYGVYAVEQNPAKLAIDIQSFEEKYSKALRSLKALLLSTFPVTPRLMCAKRACPRSRCCTLSKDRRTWTKFGRISPSRAPRSSSSSTRLARASPRPSAQVVASCPCHSH